MLDSFVSRKYLGVTCLALIMGWCLSMPVPLVGVVALVVYLVWCGQAAQRVLTELFSFTSSRRTLLLGIFLNFLTLGSWLCLALLFTTLTPLMYVLALIVNGIIWCAFERYVQRRIIPQLSEDDEDVITKEPQGFGVYAGVFVYVVLFITGLILLLQSRTGASVVTPWQTIHPHYIYIFLAATIVLGWLSLTRLSVRTMAVLFIFHLFLMHSYLPLTHQLFYGADGWRHLGNINVVLSEQPLVATTLSETPSIGARIGVITYGQMWGLFALIARITGFTAQGLITWFMPVVWAIIFPLLMVELAAAFALGRRGTFYLLWATLVPYALQVAGAFTLPVNLGLLSWLFFSVLIVKRLAAPRRDQLPVLGMLGLTALFGYSLHALLIWFGWVAAELVRKVGHRVWRLVLVLFLCVLGKVFLPAIELITKYSTLKPVDWLAAFKQIVGTFSGWYIATGPRPHDIPAGNILINQTPAAAFVPNIFTQHHWWLVIVGAVFFITVLAGALYALFHKQLVYVWVGMMTVGLTGSYIISRYFLGGEQLFTRRLDGVLAILFCITAVLLLRYLERNLSDQPRYVQLLPLALVLDAVVISALYTLGPDTGTVSVNQALAMQQVWRAEQAFDTHCVVADTYPLLALEAVSNKHIIGGGFPINQYFAQPELTAVWQQVLRGHYDLAKAYEVTKAKACWVLSPNEELNHFVKK